MFIYWLVEGVNSAGRMVMQGFHAGAVVMEGAHNTLTLLALSVYSITTYNCIISNKCA